MTTVATSQLRSMAGLCVIAVALAACTGDGAKEDATVLATPALATAEQTAFWGSLQALCGNAYAGRLVEGGASDSSFTGAELVMHVRDCSPDEIRIPFHVGDDRSRSWVITQRFAYALRREGTDRRFRVEFDLAQPVPAPPAPWGSAD